jgi:Class II flagellar assembly regulator
MRITSTQSKPPADRGRATKRTAAGGAAFGQCLAETVAADGASAPEQASAPEGLFSIQEVESATDGRSRGRAIRRADSLLDQLSELQADLLAGAVPAGRLQALTDMLRARREGIDDPRLSDLIDEIELRAEVELAKFGNAG